MVDAPALIVTARAASARGDWTAAQHDLALAREHGELSTNDLSLLANALWWMGEVPTSLAMSEEVFHRYRAEGDDLLAARKALDLGLRWLVRGDLVITSGWANRARRLLAAMPDSPERGYLLYLDACVSIDYSDLAPTREAAVALQAMGERFPSPPLTSLGLVLSGLVDIREGQPSSGFAQLDEAMLPVLSGHLPPEWAGDIYCTVIHTCYELGDTPRMRAWTQAMEQWCRQFHGEVVYSGICRVHKLQLLCLEGRWADAEESIRASGTELVGRNNWVAGEAFYEVGELRRLRGDADGAHEAYARARTLGIEPMPGEALLQLSEGQPERAWANISAALVGADQLSAAVLGGPAVEIALALRLVDAAERLSDELETTARTYGTAGFRAWAAHARARVCLAKGSLEEALHCLRVAAIEYRALHAKYQSARIHELRSVAHERLGDRDAAVAEAAQAVAIYRSLGAAPDVARLAGDEARPGGLTEREVEVLALIASGASNKETAERLCISQKTVGRHLSNIFTKLDVSTRTAAAAWARAHGIDPA